MSKDIVDLEDLIDLLKNGKCIACHEPASETRKVAPLMGRREIIHLDCAELLGIS